MILRASKPLSNTGNKAVYFRTKNYIEKVVVRKNINSGFAASEFILPIFVRIYSENENRKLKYLE